MSRNPSPVSNVNPSDLDSAETLSELQSARAEVDKRDSAAEKIKVLRARLFGKFARAIVRANADGSMDLRAMLNILDPFYGAFKIKRLSDSERNIVVACLSPEFQSVTF